MNTLLDIVGSSVIGGAILFLIIQMNISISQSLTDKTLSYTSQNNLTSIAELMDSDFKKAGLGVTDSIKFKTADTSKITILYDKDNNGTTDSISYYLSSTAKLSSTPNPSDRFLYRVVNNDPEKSVNLGVTKFRLWYYDASGRITKYRSKIKYFKVALNVESLYANGGSYGGAYWEKIFNPKNL